MPIIWKTWLKPKFTEINWHLQWPKWILTWTFNSQNLHTQICVLEDGIFLLTGKQIPLKHWLYIIQKKYLLVKNYSTDQRKSFSVNSKWWLHLLCANFHSLWMGDLKRKISSSIDLIFRITKSEIKGGSGNTGRSCNIKNRANIMEAFNEVLSFFLS